MSKSDLRPGNGWKPLGGPVYGLNGMRIHINGVCRLESGEIIYGDDWPNYMEMSRMIKINGGNRKRGVMAWARNLAYNNQ